MFEYLNPSISYRMGPPVDSVNRWFISGEKNMVFGRYNELVNGDYKGL